MEVAKTLSREKIGQKGKKSNAILKTENINY
jgi:hypothetical protein